jgi:subtilisin family serine protease
MLAALVFAGGPPRRTAFSAEGETPVLPYAQGEVLAKFKPGVSVNALNQLAAQNGMVVKKRFALLSELKGCEYVLLKSSVADTAGMMNVLQNNAAVAAVSPNNLNQVDAVPNDPYYAPYMWGLNNTAQTGGTADADIDAPEAWDVSTGSANNIVAVIDTGFTYTHPDLAANAWANSAELAGIAGVDDDGNGYVDDVYGIDPAGTDGFTPDSDPMDGYGHGTHCAGTIGAVGNNSLGIVGVNWNVKIMGLKFMDESGGNGWDSYAIECIEYILFQKLRRGRNIVAVNASWGSYNYFDQALYDAIAALGDAGIVFSTSAGNDANDNDGTDVHYPSSYDLDNIITVAATDHDDLIADFSNWGLTSVDLGTPGVSIASTIPPYYTPGNGGDIFFDNCSAAGSWVTSGTNNTWAITSEYEVFWGGAYPGAPSPPTFWSDSPGVGGGYGYYAHNTNSFLTFNADINLSGYAGTDIYFGMNIGRHISNFDHLYVEISKDSGANWSVLHDWGPTGGYVYFWAASSWLIPEDFKTANFRVQFHFVSDASSRGLGVVIDDVGVGQLNTFYELWDGTSMATPHVTGAVALMASQFPAESLADRIDRILSTVDHNTSLEGLCVTEGRLNLYNAITHASGSETITVTAPNGGEEWTPGTSHSITWTSTGSIAEVNIDYSSNGGSDWLPVASHTANDGSHAWVVPVAPSTNCLVRVRDAADADRNDTSDAPFTILYTGEETVSVPDMPVGPGSGIPGEDYMFTVKGSESSMGHALWYRFDWGDGAHSEWIAEGAINTQGIHSWSDIGTYLVRAQARCAMHPDIVSNWSDPASITIANSVSPYYNLPASRLILPEASWATASGGGTWISELQLWDKMGGSIVEVYYNSGTNRRGPFTLWDNTGGAAGSCIRFANILQTIDELDGDVFTYFGTGGALELITQDGSQLIQAAVRTCNGNYSRTFPGLADVATNTASGFGGMLAILNVSNDGSYRPSVSLFNTSADSAEVEVKIVGSDGAQVGGTIHRSLAGHEQNTIVDEVRANMYSNADIHVAVTAGNGRVIASGQTAHNASNDPAAHLAVQISQGYANSPGTRLVLPEVSWAAASGGGDWVSELHISDMLGGAAVTAYYNTGASRRGPFMLWNNSGGAGSITFANILQLISTLDGQNHYGSGGSLELLTQDGSHLIQAAVRTYNGNFSRTFPALLDREENTTDISRSLLIPNVCNNPGYRPSLVLFNTTTDSVTVEVNIIDSNGTQIGSTITRTLAGYEQSTIVDEVRALIYDDATFLVKVTSGSGRVIVSGQSANNTSNDPAAHIAVLAAVDS